MQQFGGSHTADKLGRVRRYLVEFTTLMGDKNFRLAYIDPFAGSGSYTPKSRTPTTRHTGFFPELKPRTFDGSARIALQVKPGFDRYIFIDKSARNIAQLKGLRDQHPDIRDRIRLKIGDANARLRNICRHYDWGRWRAVLFLDPYGMQVEWATIEAVAQTRAIDLWCLFPVGAAVNRLLRRDDRISPAGNRRLDLLFGSHDWHSAFYKRTKCGGFFSEHTNTVKRASFRRIGEYFLDRLQSVFGETAGRPRGLYAKSNIPLYWLCFAAGANGDARQRVKIAESILALPRFRVCH